MRSTAPHPDLIKPPIGRDVIVQRAEGFTGSIQGYWRSTAATIFASSVLEANHIKIKDVTGSVSTFEGVDINAPANADGIEIGPRLIARRNTDHFQPCSRIDGISGSYSGVSLPTGSRFGESNPPPSMFLLIKPISNRTIKHSSVLTQLAPGSDI